MDVFYIQNETQAKFNLTKCIDRKSLHFRPVVFTIDSDPSFEGNFVLATLADKADATQRGNTQSATQAATQPTTQRTNTARKPAQTVSRPSTR